MLEIITNAAFIFLFAIASVITIAVLLEFEKEGWATTIFSLASALIIWNYRDSIIEFVLSSPGTTFGFIGSYIVGGLIWSLIKWKSYINNKIESFQRVKEKFESNGGSIKNQWNNWISYLNSHLNRSFFEGDTPEEVAEKVIPKASDKKSLITSWISYWPASLAATLLNNPFRKFFEWIYSIVSGVYDKMGQSAQNSISKGMEKAQPETKKKVLQD